MKHMVMKPHSFSGKGSVLTFLAKFDIVRGVIDGLTAKSYTITPNVGRSAAKVLWDLQSDGAVSYPNLRATLEQVYGVKGRPRFFGTS